MGKAHDPRFIIEVRGEFSGFRWVRSLTVPGHFPTREEAQTAVAAQDLQSQYRIRSK